MSAGRWVLNQDMAVAFNEAIVSTPLTCFPLTFDTNARAFVTSWMAASIESEAVDIARALQKR